MSSRIVIGHKAPDTDSIGSAILLAHFETEIGRPTEARALGTPNAETAYVLERFGLEAPDTVDSVSSFDEVLIVDHSEKAQAPSDLSPDQIVGIIDHHKLGDIQTSRPPSVMIAPLGSTATVLYQLYSAEGIEMPDPLKGLALSCILSDTVILKSPTTTDVDREVAETLAEDLDIELVELGKAQFAAKANFSSKPPSEVLAIDMKPYEMGSKTVAIAQVEVPDTTIVLGSKAAYLSAMREACSQHGYDSFVLMITDIVEEGSVILVVGMEDEVATALGIELDEHQGSAPGVMSRKKQVVPPLESALS